MSNFSINVKQDVFKLFDIYYSSKFEVGGILFGKFENDIIHILAISLKKGTPNEVTFNSKDVPIFIVPEGMEVVGTWHSHIDQRNIAPSEIDYRQWSKWNRKYVHIIINHEECVVFYCNRNISRFKTLKEGCQ